MELLMGHGITELQYIKGSQCIWWKGGSSFHRGSEIRWQHHIKKNVGDRGQPLMSTVMVNIPKTIPNLAHKAL